MNFIKPDAVFSSVVRFGNDENDEQEEQTPRVTPTLEELYYEPGCFLEFVPWSELIFDDVPGRFPQYELQQTELERRKIPYRYALWQTGKETCLPYHFVGEEQVLQARYEDYEDGGDLDGKHLFLVISLRDSHFCSDHKFYWILWVYSSSSFPHLAVALLMLCIE
jgi:hypothetical protein